MSEFRQASNLYLEDLAVGDRFRSGEFVLDEAALKAFATQYDPQPFHLDDGAARLTLFDGLAASGWQTAAITMRLLVTSGMPLAGGLVGAGCEIEWPRPTRAGDTLHVESCIQAIRPSRSRPDRGIVSLESLTLNQRGEVAQKLVSRLVVFRRPA